jgi:hypothetical protein
VGATLALFGVVEMTTNRKESAKWNPSERTFHSRAKRNQKTPTLIPRRPTMIKTVGIRSFATGGEI